MDIHTNISSGVALYEQIAEQIKQLIVKAELTEGEPFPSVRALAQQLGVSVITTRRAYTELEQERICRYDSCQRYLCLSPV